MIPVGKSERFEADFSLRYYLRESPQGARIFFAAKERKDRKEGLGKAQSLCSMCSFVANRFRLAAPCISMVQPLRF
jgi:hypothetical protein